MRMSRALCTFALAAVLSGCGGVVTTHSPSPSEVCGHIRNEQDKSLCEERLISSAQRRPSDDVKTLTGPSVFWAMGFSALAWVWWAGYYLAGLVLARFVYVDAKSREWLTFRVRPLWWAAVCLFQPALGVLVYWVLHYSRLSRHAR